MASESSGSSFRKGWFVVLAFVVFAVGLSLIEGIGTDPQTSADHSGVDGGEETASSIAAPEVVRLEGGGVEIRHDFFRRSTIRLNDDEAEKALFECLEHGIEKMFAKGTTGWTGARVRDETRRVQDECLRSRTNLPVPPRPPT
jgi:hypothetical protein